jgi:hypothetical protein
MGRGGSGVGHGILEAWYARDLDGRRYEKRRCGILRRFSLMFASIAVW